MFLKFDCTSIERVTAHVRNVIGHVRSHSYFKKWVCVDIKCRVEDCDLYAIFADASGGRCRTIIVVSNNACAQYWLWHLAILIFYARLLRNGLCGYSTVENRCLKYFHNRQRRLRESARRCIVDWIKGACVSHMRTLISTVLKIGKSFL